MIYHAIIELVYLVMFCFHCLSGFHSLSPSLFSLFCLFFLSPLSLSLLSHSLSLSLSLFYLFFLFFTSQLSYISFLSVFNLSLPHHLFFFACNPSPLLMFLFFISCFSFCWFAKNRTKAMTNLFPAEKQCIRGFLLGCLGRRKVKETS